VPQISSSKEDYGSDLYAACRTAVQLTLEPGGHSLTLASAQARTRTCTRTRTRTRTRSKPTLALTLYTLLYLESGGHWTRERAIAAWSPLFDSE
jgi:hypothetical protein